MCHSNAAAMLLVWLPFVWCFALLTCYAGALDQFSVGGPVLGALLILSTIGVLAMVIKLLVMDLAGKAKTMKASRRSTRQSKALAKCKKILRGEGRVYRKVEKTHARVLQEDQLFSMDGGEEGETLETEFAKGDYVLIGSRGDRYPMTRSDFAAWYDIVTPGAAESAELTAEGFRLFAPKGKVWAHELTPAERSSHFPDGTFVGSWGGKKAVAATDILVMSYPQGDEVDSIPKELFTQSYEFVRVVPEGAQAELEEEEGEAASTSIELHDAEEETVTIEAANESSWAMSYFMCSELPPTGSADRDDGSGATT